MLGRDAAREAVFRSNSTSPACQMGDQMAGDADMSREEMVVRIAMLEGIVFALIEERAREAGGLSDLRLLAQRIGAAANERAACMPPEMKEGVQAHFAFLLEILEDRVASAPTASTATS